MRRLPELDAVKGLSVLAIAAAPALLWPIEGAAVELFVVLSAYFLTARVEARTDTLGHEFRRRALRLAPAYLVALYGLAMVPHPGQVLSRHGPLALIVQGAIAWPIVLRLPRPAARLVVFAALAASITARAWGWNPWLLIDHADGFAFGTLLAWTFADADWVGSRRRLIRCVLLPVALALLGFLIREYHRGGLPLDGTYPRPASTVLALDLFGSAVLGLILAHEGLPILGWLRVAPLCELGRLSYGTTLFWVLLQPFARGLAERHPAAGGLAPAVLTLGISVCLAALVSRFVERPIRAWGEPVPAGAEEDHEGTRRDRAHDAPSRNVSPRGSVLKGAASEVPPGSATKNAGR
jgi:peptidoglycan/LPS O-acetylase OafA/YrhL